MMLNTNQNTMSIRAVVSNGYGAMVFYNLLPSIDYSFGLNEVGKNYMEKKLYGVEKHMIKRLQNLR